MLKQTRVNLDLITDPELDRMLANSMRGGICMISGRYSKANNKYMGTLSYPTKPRIYISNLDANYLYGKAMSYLMPNLGSRGSPRSNGVTSIDWRREKINTPAISSNVTWSIPLNSTRHTTTIHSHRRESPSPSVS